MPVTIIIVPMPSIKLTVSFKKITAKIAANKGVDETTAEALDAPTRLIAWKFNNLPPKNVISPANINQRKAIGASDIISSECKTKAKIIVTAIDDNNDMTVAVLTLTEDMAAFINTALNPKPKAAISESIIPVSKLAFFS
tara:strand:+ start:7164 stop:7583 length:420 start_codon:yes stop_codon:yes gene_type:complete